MGAATVRVVSDFAVAGGRNGVGHCQRWWELPRPEGGITALRGDLVGRHHRG